MTRCLGRFEGRLFAQGGCLFMVVHADETAGTARVSCRVADKTQIIEMPLAEVAKRVASGAALILDNLNGPVSAKRIREERGGWYFSAREGRMGPFGSKAEADRELVRYILTMQTNGSGSRREPLRSPARHRELAESSARPG